MSPTPFNVPLNAKIVAKHGTTSIYALRDGRLAFVDHAKNRTLLDGSRDAGSGTYGAGHNSEWADARIVAVAAKGGSSSFSMTKALRPSQSSRNRSSQADSNEEIPDDAFARMLPMIPKEFLDWADSYKPGDPLPAMMPGYGDALLCEKSISNDRYAQDSFGVDQVVETTLRALGLSDINPALAFAPEPETKSMPQLETKGILGREIRDMARNIADSILSARGLWRDELNKIRCGSGPNANRFTDIFGTGCDVPGANMAGNIVGAVRSGVDAPGPVDEVAGKLEGARESFADAADGFDVPGSKPGLGAELKRRLTGTRGGHTPHYEGDSPIAGVDPAAAMGPATPARPSKRWNWLGVRSLLSRNKRREREKQAQKAADTARKEYATFLSSDEYRRWEADFVRTNGRMPHAGEKIDRYARHLGWEGTIKDASGNPIVDDYGRPVGSFMGMADTSAIGNRIYPDMTHFEAIVEQIARDPRNNEISFDYLSPRQQDAKRKEIAENIEEYALFTLDAMMKAGGPRQIEVVQPDGTRALVDNPEHKKRFAEVMPTYLRVKHPSDSLNNVPGLSDAAVVTSVNTFVPNLEGPGGFVTQDLLPGQMPAPMGAYRLGNTANGALPAWVAESRYEQPFMATITLDPIWFGSKRYQKDALAGFSDQHLGMSLSKDAFWYHTADHELNHVDDFAWRLGQKLGYLGDTPGVGAGMSEWMDRLSKQRYDATSKQWSGTIDLMRDAAPWTFLGEQVSQLQALLSDPGISEHTRRRALWEFYMNNFQFDSRVESAYARWLAFDDIRAIGGARLTKARQAELLAQIRENLIARGYGEETGVPELNFWKDMLDTPTGRWDPVAKRFDFPVDPATGRVQTEPRNIMDLPTRGKTPYGQARLDNAVSNLLHGFIGGTYAGESDFEFAAELRTQLNKPGALKEIREFLADKDRNIHNLDESHFMTLVAKYVGHDEVYRLYGERPPDRSVPPSGGGGGSPGGGGPGGGGPGGGGALRPAIPLGPGPTRATPTTSGSAPSSPTGRVRGTATRPTIPMVPRADEPTLPPSPPESRSTPGNLRGRGVRPTIDLTEPTADVPDASPDTAETVGASSETPSTGRLRGEGVRRPARPASEIDKLAEPEVRSETDADRVSPERMRADAAREGRRTEESSDDRKMREFLDDWFDMPRDERSMLSLTEDQRVAVENDPRYVPPRVRGADAERMARGEGSSPRNDTERRARPTTTSSAARDELNAARERARDRRWAEREEAERRSEEASRSMAEARESGSSAAVSDEARLDQLLDERTEAIRRVVQAEINHDRALRRARATGSDPDRGGDGDPQAWADYRAAYEELNDADAARSRISKEQREIGERMSREATRDVRSFEAPESPASATTTGETPRRQIRMVNQTTGEVIYVDPNNERTMQEVAAEGFAPDVRQARTATRSRPRRSPASRNRRYSVLRDGQTVLYIPTDDLSDAYVDAIRDGFVDVGEVGESERRRARDVDAGMATRRDVGSTREWRDEDIRSELDTWLTTTDFRGDANERNDEIDTFVREFANDEDALYEIAQDMRLNDGRSEEENEILSAIETILENRYAPRRESRTATMGAEDVDAGMGRTYERLVSTHAEVVNQKREAISETKRVLSPFVGRNPRDLTASDVEEMAPPIERLFSGEIRIDANPEGSLLTELAQTKGRVVVEATVDTDRISSENGRLSIPITMTLSSPDGEFYYGVATRTITIDRDGINVNHGSLSINQGFRGLGIASEFNARNENLYKAIGARQIRTMGTSSAAPDMDNELMPDIVYQTGATHWARNGFTWQDEGSKNKFISVIDDAIKNRPGIFSAEERQRIGSLYSRNRDGTFKTNATPEELVNFEAADRLFAEQGAIIGYRRDLGPLEERQPRTSRLSRIADRLGRRRPRYRYENQSSEPPEWDPDAEIRAGEGTNSPNQFPEPPQWDPNGEIEEAIRRRRNASVVEIPPPMPASFGDDPFAAMAAPRRNSAVVAATHSDDPQRIKTEVPTEKNQTNERILRDIASVSGATWGTPQQETIRKKRESEIKRLENPGGIVPTDDKKWETPEEAAERVDATIERTVELVQSGKLVGLTPEATEAVRGKSKEEIKQMLVDALRAQVAGLDKRPRFRIRGSRYPDTPGGTQTDPTPLHGFIRTGRWMSVHEHTGQTPSSDAKQRIERDILLGLPEQLPSNLRPAHGYVLNADEIAYLERHREARAEKIRESEMYRPERFNPNLVDREFDESAGGGLYEGQAVGSLPYQYGATEIILKPEVAQRTIITFGDSFSGMRTPVPIDGSAPDEQLLEAGLLHRGQALSGNMFSGPSSDTSQARIVSLLNAAVSGNNENATAVTDQRYPSERSRFYIEGIVAGGFTMDEVEEILVEASFEENFMEGRSTIDSASVNGQMVTELMGPYLPTEDLKAITDLLGATAPEDMKELVANLRALTRVRLQDSRRIKERQKIREKIQSRMKDRNVAPPKVTFMNKYGRDYERHSSWPDLLQRAQMDESYDITDVIGYAAAQQARELLQANGIRVSSESEFAAKKPQPKISNFTSPSQRAMAISRLRSGQVTVSELAEQLGVAESTIYSWMEE